MRKSPAIVVFSVALLAFGIAFAECGVRGPKIVAKFEPGDSNYVRMTKAVPEFRQAFAQHGLRYADSGSAAAAAFVEVYEENLPMSESETESLMEIVVDSVLANGELLELSKNGEFFSDKQIEFVRDTHTFLYIQKPADVIAGWRVKHYENQQKIAAEQKRLIEEQEAARIAEIEQEQEIREQKRKRILATQEQLNLLGYELVPDGLLGPKTEAALGQFQTNNHLSVTRTVDVPTENLLSIATKERYDEVRLFNGILFGVPASDGDVRRLRKELGFEDGFAYTNDVQTKANAKLVELEEAYRQRLVKIGFGPLETTENIDWEYYVQRFQKAYDIQPEMIGKFEPTTTLVIDNLFSLALNVQQLRTTASTWNRFGQTELPPEPIPDGLLESTSFFLVDPQLASHIVKILNDTLGDNFIVTGDEFDVYGRNRVAMAIVDTRHPELKEVIDDFIRVDKIGAGIAIENGVALYAAQFDGKAILQSVRNGKSEFSLTNTFWDRILRVFGNTTRQSRVGLTSLVKKSVGGVDFVFVEGDTLNGYPLESMSTVPVIRSAKNGRNVEELATKIDSAKNRNFSKRNTMHFIGTPQSQEQYEQLQSAEHPIQGDFKSSWADPSKNITDILNHNSKTGYNSNSKRANEKQLTRNLTSALSNKDNVIIVVAHQSGNTLYFPGPNGLIEIRSADLEAAKSAIADNAPTVLLLSCETAPSYTNKDTFGSKLIELGAGLVIAPSRNITPYEAEDFLTELYTHNKDEKSLLEASVLALSSANLLSTDPTLKFFVLNSFGDK